METVINYVCYFLEHLEELLIDTLNPLKRAALFSLIFDVMPNYSELTSGTPKLAPFLALKDRFNNSLVSVGEPTVPNLELVTDSLIKTYYKLTELGFVEINGIITLIDYQEDEL